MVEIVEMKLEHAQALGTTAPALGMMRCQSLWKYGFHGNLIVIYDIMDGIMMELWNLWTHGIMTSNL